MLPMLLPHAEALGVVGTLPDVSELALNGRSEFKWIRTLTQFSQGVHLNPFPLARLN